MKHIKVGGGEASRPAVFAELAAVRLEFDVPVNNQVLPAGTAGTIVAAYQDGVGYEVEFEQPFHAVVTLSARDLRA